MINLLEEIEKLMKERPLPYGRKPISARYQDNGDYQEAFILCSPKCIIWMVHSWQIWVRNESACGCYVLENDVWMDYQLIDILWRRKKIKDNDKRKIKKSSRTLTFEESQLLNIKSTYNSLLEYGDDVLRGDLEWTKETRYPPLPAHADIYTPFKKDGDDTSYTHNVDFVSVPPDPATLRITEYEGIVTPYGILFTEEGFEKSE